MGQSPPLAPSLVERLYDESRGARWGLPVELFRTALEASVEHAFAARNKNPAPDDVDRYAASLHLHDLALACACAAGKEPAWDHFVLEHRPALYRAADAIDPGGGARDLADALYADLFGLRERDGVRQSLFRYFHGRSSLATWLRAVLSQRQTDRLRAGRRLDPLPDDDSAPIGSSVAAGHAHGAAPDPERPRFFTAMRTALAAAIAALAPRDRLRLGCYYTQDLTLAAIGRLLGEHEATVSRHLTRTRRAIREAVEARLQQQGLDDRAVAECFRSVVDDPGSLDLADLIGATPAGPPDPEPARKNDGLDRSR